MDGVWLNSGYFDGNRGEIHKLRGREAIAKTLVREGFSSLALLVFPRLRSLPKLDVAGSTPVARSTFSLNKSRVCANARSPVEHTNSKVAPRSRFCVAQSQSAAILDDRGLLLDPYHTNAMRLRSQRQSAIVSRHHQFFAGTLAPE